jgi:hypothetical protein
VSFDTEKLKQYAEGFEQIASKYASQDEEAAGLYAAMSSYIKDAKAGAILAPIKMPAIGRFYFDEGNLRRYVDLNDAYAKFSLKLRGYQVAGE